MFIILLASFITITLATEYYDEAEISMDWTAKGNGLENRIAYVEEMVDNYKRNVSTTSDDNLSFDQLPLDVYDIAKVRKNAAYLSRAVYKITARLTCILTDSDTHCVVAYNQPFAQTKLYFLLVLLLCGIMVLIPFILFILLKYKQCRQQRYTSLPQYVST